RDMRLRGLPIRGASGWRHRYCLLGTPLVREGKDATDAVGALLDWIARDAEGADILLLHHIPAGGAFPRAPNQRLAERHRTVVTTNWHTRAVLRRGPSAKVYMEAALSPHTRKICAKYEKRLCERGAVAWRTLEPGQEAGPWIEDFLALEASGWKGREGCGRPTSAANAPSS